MFNTTLLTGSLMDAMDRTLPLNKTEASMKQREAPGNFYFFAISTSVFIIVLAFILGLRILKTCTKEEVEELTEEERAKIDLEHF